MDPPARSSFGAMKRPWFRVLWLGWLAFATTSVSAQAPNEYQVKALFLLRFAQFVEWPDTAFTDAQAPLVIGVLGQDPFGASLDEAVAGETANRRSIVVQRFRNPDEIKTCHILFISGSEGERLEQIFARLRGRPILTVGDGEAFAWRGGVIRFLAENSRTRFRVNLTAAKEANLLVSSKLLRSAEVIDPGQKQP
jgi:hypothetical protein